MANNIAVFPESPQSNNQAIGPGDYITVSLWSGCLDPNKYPDDWMKRNTITLTVKLQVAGKNVSFPIYNDYSAGGTQLLATNEVLLLRDAPCNGSNLGISATVFRSDKDDFVPTLINLLSGAKQNLALTTYASSAVPAIELSGIVAGDIYNAFFPQHGNSILDTNPVTLVTGGIGNNLLRDCFMLQYYGTDNMTSDALEVRDNGDVDWKGEPPNPLRSGSWLLFRIQRSTSRADQHSRPWDILFNKAISEFSGLPTANPAHALEEFTSATTLVQNDPDVTDLNKASVYEEYGQVYIAASGHHMRGRDALVYSALQSSSKDVFANGMKVRIVDPKIFTAALQQLVH
jgi:hypothetical protein